MAGTFIIIVIIVSVLLFVAFEVLVSMGNAGINPSKFISDIIKKADRDDLKSKRDIQEIESVEKEVADENKSESDDYAQLTEEIKKWRLAAGILFALVMVFILVFYRSGAFSGLFALASFTFWPLIFITVIVFIILHQKEKKLKK